jgi:hypothetical protein
VDSYMNVLIEAFVNKVGAGFKTNSEIDGWCVCGLFALQLAA